MKRVPAALLAALAVLAAPAARAADFPNQIKIARFAIETGLFNVIFAKELCSCLFVDGLSRPECEARDNLPAAAHKLVTLKIDPSAKTVSSTFVATQVKAALLLAGVPFNFQIGGPAEAKLVSPELGCVLTKGPAD